MVINHKYDKYVTADVIDDDKRLTEADVNEFTEITEKTTELPWFSYENDHVWQLYGGYNGNFQLLKVPKRDKSYMEYWPNEADGRFIVAARRMVPLLIVDWHRLQRELLESQYKLEYLAYGALFASILTMAHRMKNDPEMLKLIKSQGQEVWEAATYEVLVNSGWYG